jgi:PAS domain S-box-containing protein
MAKTILIVAESSTFAANGLQWKVKHSNNAGNLMPTSQPLILVADDDSAQRSWVITRLEEAGYRWLEADDGHQAVQHYQHYQPDLVLLDMHMPGLNGYEVCRAIRALPTGVEVPILISTAMDDAETILRVFEAGATDYFNKHFPFQLLKQRIHNFLLLRQSQTALQAAQRETAEALVRERALLRTLIDNLPDLIFVKDTEGRFMVSNQANAASVGAGHPREIIGKTDFDFYPESRAASFQADDYAILSSRQPMLHHQIRVYYEESDSYRWYDITKVPFTDSYDKLLGLVGMIRDISAEKEAEQQLLLANAQLAELNDLKSHFLLTMSHELRTPLGVILGNTQLLLAGMAGELSEKQLDRIERIQRNAGNLLAMIEDILDISKVLTGRMELASEAVAFPLILEAMLPDFIQEAQAKGLEVLQDLTPDLPMIQGDAPAIQKILLNLVSNAIKFTHNGYVYIGAQPIPPSVAANLPLELPHLPQGWVMLTVQDTGVGISQEVKQTIFDEFRQADGSATRQQGGTGLGLALCHHLVRLMNGHLWLESALGYGSTFFVLLPAGTAD